MRHYKRLNQAGKEAAALKFLDMALHSLGCMMRGGIHDHIGGGFHRYSVDEYWHGTYVIVMLFFKNSLYIMYM